MSDYKVTLYHVYTVTAPNREEAQSAAWKALDDDLIPDYISASVQRVQT